MSNHGYHTRNILKIKHPNNKTSLLIALSSRFDNLSLEFLNLEDVIIKKLPIENER